MATWSTGLSLRGSPGAQLRYGSGSPGNTNPAVQNDGDAYLDLATGNLYAVRQNGLWPAAPSTNIVGATGPASVVTVQAPPGPNVGVVGGYAVWNNNGIVLLYGPKTSSGWTQTSPDAQGNQYPVSVQLTGAKGDVGAAGKDGTSGSNGLSVLFGSGAPASSLGVVGQPGYIDYTNLQLYAAKTASGWPTTTTPLYAPQILVTTGAPASGLGNVNDIAIDQANGFVYGPKSSSGWPTAPLVSTVGPAGPKGDTGAAAVLPNDYTGNSFVVVPVSGDTNVVQLAIKNSAGTVLWKADGSGNQTVANLTASGTSTLAAVNATNIAASGTLSASGTSTLAAVTANSLSSTGTLSAQGASTLAAVGATNVTASGTLGVQGTSTLAAVNATNVSASGTLSASGATTLAALNATTVAASGNATVGGTLGVTGATNAAAITSSATVAAKNLTLTSGSGGVLTFADGTTMATAASGTGGSTGGGGGTSLDTVYLGLHNATSGNYPTAYTANNGYFTNTQVIGGTATTTGSAYVSPYAGTVYSIEVFAVSASNPISVCLYKNGSATALVATSTSNGGSFYATASTSTPITVAAGDQFQLFVKGTTASMTNSLIGWMTVQPAGSGSGGQVARTAIDMGGYQYGSNSAGGYSPTKKLNATAGTTNNASNSDLTIRMPWAGSIVGYSLQQNVSSVTTNSIVYSKNGTNYPAITAGTGAGTFWGTHAVTAYPFVAGDKIQLLTGIANGGNTDVIAAIYVQWTDAASASTATVTADPSFNSLTVAPVSGNSNPSLITAPSLTLTSGGGGKITYADGTTQTTAAVASASASRTLVDMGSFYNTGVNGGSLYGIYRAVPNATSPGTYSSAAFYDQLLKLPYGFSITGYSVINAANTAFTLYYYKNGSSLGSFGITGTAGSYAGTHAKGTYPFAAGDTFRVVVQPNTSTANFQIYCTIEWT